MLRENLEEMTREEIRNLAYTNKIEIPRTVTKKDEIIDHVVESLAKQGQKDEPVKQESKPKSPLKALTKDDIADALEGLSGIKIQVNDQDSTWKMIYEGKGVTLEDSGTLYMPLPRLRKCAEMLMV